MKKLTRFLSLGAVTAVLLTAIVRADTVTETGFLADPPNTNASTTDVVVDLNDFDTWAFYASGLTNRAPTTDASNLGKFTSFTNNSGILNSLSGGYIFVSYTGGAGGANPSSATSTNAHDTTTGGFSITTTLFAPEESLSFYLLSFDAAVDLSATIGSGTFSLNDVPLPLLTVPNGSLTDGSSNRQGTLVLDVTGNVGDVLTFTATADENGVSNPSTGNVSLIAVGASAVPEPMTWVMVLDGLAGCWAFGIIGFADARRSRFHS